MCEDETVPKESHFYRTSEWTEVRNDTGMGGNGPIRNIFRLEWKQVRRKFSRITIFYMTWALNYGSYKTELKILLFIN